MRQNIFFLHHVYDFISLMLDIGMLSQELLPMDFEDIPLHSFTNIIYSSATIGDDKITPAESDSYKRFFPSIKRNYKIRTVISVKAPPSQITNRLLTGKAIGVY